jgi:hypothetical protein
MLLVTLPLVFFVIVLVRLYTLPSLKLSVITTVRLAGVPVTDRVKVPRPFAVVSTKPDIERLIARNAWTGATPKPPPLPPPLALTAWAALRTMASEVKAKSIALLEAFCLTASSVAETKPLDDGNGSKCSSVPSSRDKFLRRHGAPNQTQRNNLRLMERGMDLGDFDPQKRPRSIGAPADQNLARQARFGPENLEFKNWRPAIYAQCAALLWQAETPENPRGS